MFSINGKNRMDACAECVREQRESEEETSNVSK
jgi:hypothetical protein